MHRSPCALWLTLQGLLKATVSCSALTARKTQSTRHRAVTQIIFNASEPPVQAAPLMREPEAANLFRRQSRHECTLSHQSPRGRRSREFNQQARIRASTRVALHCHAGFCRARNTGVDHHARMAGGQGLQPLVTTSQSRPGQLLPTGLSDCGTLAILLAILGRSGQCSRAIAQPRPMRPNVAPSARPAIAQRVKRAQSGLGVRCATAWIASPRSASLASCS